AGHVTGVQTCALPIYGGGDVVGGRALVGDAAFQLGDEGGVGIEQRQQPLVGGLLLVRLELLEGSFDGGPTGAADELDEPGVVGRSEERRVGKECGVRR